MATSKRLLGVPAHRAADEWMLGDRGHPLCFDSKTQYEQWAEAADEAPDAETAARGICADCTLLYRNQMINAGRCSRVLVPFPRHQQKPLTFAVAHATLHTTAPIAVTETQPEEEVNHVD